MGFWYHDKEFDLKQEVPCVLVNESDESQQCLIHSEMHSSQTFSHIQGDWDAPLPQDGHVGNVSQREHWLSVGTRTFPVSSSAVRVQCLSAVLLGWRSGCVLCQKKKKKNYSTIFKVYVIFKGIIQGIAALVRCHKVSNINQCIRPTSKRAFQRGYRLCLT